VFSGGPSSTQTRQVNERQIADAITAAQNSVVLRSVLVKVLGDVVDCGMEVWLNYNGERIDLRDSERAIIEHDWKAFVRQLLWHLEVVGIVAVGRDSRDGRPYVVPYHHIRIMFSDSPYHVREYWVEEQSAVSGTGAPKRMNARVFVRFEPALDGSLTSPGAACVPHAQALESLQSCQRYADYTRTHPTWTYEADHDAKTRPDPTEYDVVYEGQISQEYNEYQQMIASQQQLMHAQTQEQSLAAYRSMLASMGTFAAYSSAPAEARAQPPWTNYAFVPLGMRLAPAPTAQPNPHYQSEAEYRIAMMLIEFRVPPSEMELSHAVRYSTQPSVARLQWGTTVRTLQSELSRMIVEVYMFVNSDVMREYAASMVRHVASLRAEAANAVRKIIEDDEGSAARRTAEDDDDGSAADGDDDGTRKRQRRAESAPSSPAAGSPSAAEPTAEQLVDAAVADVPDVGAPAKPPGSDTLQFPETAESLRRAQELLELDDSQVLAYVQQHFSVTVRFCARPNFTDPVKELAPLVQQNVLSLDNYAQLAADALGVPKDMLLLDDQARLKEAEHRRALTEAATPAEPAQPGGGVKRKAPPARQ